MKSLRIFCSIPALMIASSLSACSDTQSKSPDVTDSIRRSLDQAGLKDVSVSQDRDKGVVTLSGATSSEADKGQAESIAKSFAGSQVVSDEIAVRPPGMESVAKKVDSDLDAGIKKNVDAALVSHKLDKGVRYDVNNGVVTLTGSVNSQSKRAEVERLARECPTSSR